jgi:hypothetical protein
MMDLSLEAVSHILITERIGDRKMIKRWATVLALTAGLAAGAPATHFWGAPAATQYNGTHYWGVHYWGHAR